MGSFKREKLKMINNNNSKQLKKKLGKNENKQKPNFENDENQEFNPFEMEHQCNEN